MPDPGQKRFAAVLDVEDASSGAGPRRKLRVHGESCADLDVEELWPSGHGEAKTHMGLRHMRIEAPDFGALLAYGLPRVLLCLIFLVYVNPAFDVSIKLQVVEFFAGNMAITRAFQRKRVAALPYDIILTKMMRQGSVMRRVMNLNSSEGFALALCMVLRCHPGALIWLAPVCSSWVFLNLGTSLRNTLAPLGHENREENAEANMMASRCVLLMWLAMSLGMVIIMETNEQQVALPPSAAGAHPPQADLVCSDPHGCIWGKQPEDATALL
jgi:hypothetical protein